MSEPRLSYERNIFRTIAHVEASEKILVLYRSRVAAAVVLQVLQIGFDHGMHVSHLRHEKVLALHHMIENVV